MQHEYNIIKLGNPLLRKKSSEIPLNELGSKKIKDIEELMFYAMHKEKGVGLAAPQIGLSKQIIVFGLDKHPSNQEIEPIPYTILINPSFTPLSDEKEVSFEGCLSVGSLRGKVSRYTNIIYKGYDSEGNFIEREASGLHSRVIQHEIDHLNGIVFLDKVEDSLSIGFHDELVNSGVFNSNT